MGEGFWEITYTGKKMHFITPSPEEICIEDIAHALTNNSLLKMFFSTGHLNWGLGNNVYNSKRYNKSLWEIRML